MAERVVIRGHPVDRCHRPKRTGIVVAAPVAHHAHGAHRQQGHEGLPDRIVQPVAPDLVQIDGIGPAQDRQLIAGDLARAADRQARTGEGMAADEAVGQAQLAAQGADLVLEQFAQRFDQLQPHLLGQAADIVVALDGDRGPAGERDRLDHVGIERALGQELGAADLGRVLLEHVDEQPADGLALDLGIGDAGQRVEEQVGFVGMDQRDVVVVAEHRHDLVRLALAKQSVVDEDAGQLVADRLVDQHRRDRAVDAAGQTADHLAGADLGADLLDRLLAVGAHGPVALEAGQPDEVLVQPRAAGGVVDLGVELHREEVAGGIGGDREGRAGRGAVDLEARGDPADMVAVAHPDLLAPVGEPAVKDRQRCVGRCDEGAAELGGAMAGFHQPAQFLHHHLLAITDAQDRHAQIEYTGRRPGRSRPGHAVGAAREDDGPGREVLQEPVGDVLVGMDFAIDVQLAQAPRDQLRHLAAEIDDQKAVVMLGYHARCLGRSRAPFKRQRAVRGRAAAVSGTAGRGASVPRHGDRGGRGVRGRDGRSGATIGGGRGAKAGSASRRGPAEPAATACGQSRFA